MKKNYLFFSLLVFFTTHVLCQVPYKNLSPYQIAFQEVMAKKKAASSVNPQRETYDLFLDYSAANFDDLFYVWQFNTYFDNSDTNLNFACVVLDQIAGYTDPADPISTWIDWTVLGLSDAFPSSTTLLIDSVYAYVTHENNSGQDDTLKLQIITTDTTGAPSASSTVLWEEMDVSNTSISASGNWVGTDAGVILQYGPQYTTTAGQKVGLNFIYLDPSKMDTASILGGSVNNGLGGTDSKSVYENSYMRYPPPIPDITPNTVVGYGNPPGTDGWFEAQNWAIWAKVTVNVPVGIEDNFKNLAVHNIFPNPATGDGIHVLFGINEPSDITIDLQDVSGRYIRTLQSGFAAAGSHNQLIDLTDVSSGIYLISVKAGKGTPIVSKLIVAK